ncbi:MAG: TetR/AcrR family transcriptional regulator [Treponemataceae bacterium]|nr:TetR/AcrR family transcriptional regulator [Treponemataceae bacterium]
MDTKKLILSTALDLFSKKGFVGVSVRDIAKLVGVRESALYKHFKSKQEILDKIVEKMSLEVHEVYKSFQAPEALDGDLISGYKKLSEKKLCQMVWNIVQAFTGQTELAKFRRLLQREAEDIRFAECYKAFFLDGVVKSQAKTFSALIKGGFFKKEDEKLMALEFYGPVLFLFQKLDLAPGCQEENMEEVKKLLYAHIRNFGQLHRAVENQREGK